MKLEGVVFDLDATLVNMGGFVDWKEAHRKAREAYQTTECPKEFVLKCSERGLFNMLNLVRDEVSRTIPEKVEEIQLKAYDAIESCEVESIEACHLMPGCEDVLDWLEERDIRMGVATSNSQTVAEEILKRKGIDRYFAAVVGRRPELRMKPHPDQILKCFEMMGVDPSGGVVVGDSVRDVAAAKSAEIYVVAVPAYFTRRDSIIEAGADVIIDSLEDLLVVLSMLQR
ncbi:MAG: HAD family hydrolase [Candidatus Bathyarchaeota archaeon]|nr:MAG: HAD family hydrolase [Candidatus Bathyarchaeota archaeon]